MRRLSNCWKRLIVGEVGDTTQLCGTSLTVFLGGAGMSGSYPAEFVSVLQEAGICNPVAGNFPGMWGVADEKVILDMLADAVSVPFANSPWSDDPGRREEVVPPSVNEWMNMELEGLLGLSDTRDRLEARRHRQGADYNLASANISRAAPRNEDTFNIIGYSWGAVVAARMALFYASAGVEVDFLGLVGAPVNTSLLSAVRRVSLIKKVSVQNLSAQWDPIYAGMTDAEIIAASPLLIAQMVWSSEGSGHFYYSNAGTTESRMRKRRLIAQLIADGLK
jgi:pimeloyl-ACP methyl ester carboxylesterase